MGVFTLRGYQKETLDATNKSEKDVVACLPTGAGKSAVIQHIVWTNRDKKCAVVVRMSSLIDQLLETLKATNLKVSVIKAGYDFDPDFDVVLIMEQTYFARYKSYTLDIDILIKDEVHVGFSGKQYELLKQTLEPAKTIGLTATPIDEAGVCLVNDKNRDSFEYIEKVSIDDLMSQGYLMKPTYVRPSTIAFEEMISTIKVNNGEYNSKDIDNVLNTDEFNEFIVSEYQRTCADKKTIIFCNSIKQVNNVSAKLDEAKIKHVKVHSKLSNEETDKAIKKYKQNRVKTMVNMSMLTTGFDDPKTDAIILARPTKVLRLYLQIVGRVLRIANNKRVATVVDLAGSIREHGIVEFWKDFGSLLTKDKYLATKDENDLDEINELNDKITKEKVIEYRLNVKTKKIDELTRKLETKSDENEFLKDRIDEFKQHSNSLLKENTALKARVPSLEREAEGYKTKSNVLISNVRKLREENLVLENKVTNLSKELKTKKQSQDNQSESKQSNSLLGYMSDTISEEEQRLIKDMIDGYRKDIPWIEKSVKTRYYNLLEKNGIVRAEEMYSFINWLYEKHKEETREKKQNSLSASDLIG
jgi:superfamily II DNA or RNA helicase